MKIWDILTNRRKPTEEELVLWDAGVIDDALVSYEDDVEPPLDFDENLLQERD